MCVGGWVYDSMSGLEKVCVCAVRDCGCGRFRLCTHTCVCVCVSTRACSWDDHRLVKFSKVTNSCLSFQSEGTLPVRAEAWSFDSGKKL